MTLKKYINIEIQQNFYLAHKIIASGRMVIVSILDCHTHTNTDENICNSTQSNQANKQANKQT